MPIECAPRRRAGASRQARIAQPTPFSRGLANSNNLKTPMTRKLTLQLLLAACIGGALAGSAAAQGGKHFNIIGRSQTIEHGHGEIRVDGGAQEASQLEISISNGPLIVNKVLVRFADPKLKPWANAIKPRKDVEWTSSPIKWPTGKPHKVVAVEYWYTGVPGKTARIDLLGLQ